MSQEVYNGKFWQYTTSRQCNGCLSWYQHHTSGHQSKIRVNQVTGCTVGYSSYTTQFIQQCTYSPARMHTSGTIGMKFEKTCIQNIQVGPTYGQTSITRFLWQRWHVKVEKWKIWEGLGLGEFEVDPTFTLVIPLQVGMDTYVCQLRKLSTYY